MKETALALAALSIFATTASAQSNVAGYAIFDISLPLDNNGEFTL
jgi:hypothetical protein